MKRATYCVNTHQCDRYLSHNNFRLDTNISLSLKEGAASRDQIIRGKRDGPTTTTSIYERNYNHLEENQSH